jgi:membrane associated rhomboid family serine protease
MSIDHSIHRGLGGWLVLVRDDAYVAASAAIDRYEAENRDWPPPRTRERARHAPTPFVPLVFMALVAFFLVTGPVRNGSPWFDRGMAVADQVLTSQPFRAVTALTLHADALHVMGNAIAGTVFVSSLERRLGTGGALLSVLAAGALGNFASSAYYRFAGEPHVSLGASTAVFGSIGLLAATQLVLDHPANRRPRSLVERIAPILGGFALLGALGSGGERTDLGAHLCGFLAGLVLGLLIALPLRRATVVIARGASEEAHEVSLDTGVRRWWLQTMLAAAAAAWVVVSWQMAFRAR